MKSFYLFIALFLALCVTQSYARSSLYYDIVNDFNAGKNYYKILEIDSDASESDMRKSFRKLSVTKHPDKVGKAREQEYLDIVRAYDVLRDPEAKKEYDRLLIEGVPWQDQYYGRYAHKYGAPDADIRYVLLGLVTFVSIFQYFNQYYKHVTYHAYAKKTQRYQQAVKTREHEKAMRRKQKGKKGQQDDEDDEDDEDDPPVIIYGAEKPQIKDVLAVKLVLSPYLLTRALYNFGIWAKAGFPKLSEEEEDERQRIQYGFSEEEWAAEKRKNEYRTARMMDSNRYKRYKRWLKKQ